MVIQSERLTYTCDEVAVLLGCSRNLMFQLARDRKIQGVIFLGQKRLVFSKAVIDRLVREGEEVKA